MRFIDIEVLPLVHNEGETFEATIREIYAELSCTMNPGFIVCEDGSKGYTKPRSPFSFSLHWSPGVYLLVAGACADL